MSVEHNPGRVNKGPRALLIGLTLLAQNAGLPGINRVAIAAELEQEDPGKLPKGRIVYAAREKDGPDATYTSNADGSDKEALINNLGHDRRYMAVLPNGRVVYSEWKDGKANIVVLDTQTGKEQDLTTSQDKPANTIDICPSPDGGDKVNLISKLAGIRFLGWMPTSQEVLLTKKGLNGESLYIVSVDGKQARLISDMDVQGALASRTHFYSRCPLPASRPLVQIDPLSSS